MCNSLFASGAPASQTVDLTGQAIAGAEAFGSVSVTLAVAPSGITSAEAVGAAQVNLAAAPGDLASAEAWGTPAVSLYTGVTPIGIASTESFGSPSIGSPVPASGGGPAAPFFPRRPPGRALTVRPGGISSAEVVGWPRITLEDPDSLGLELDREFDLELA